MVSPSRDFPSKSGKVAVPCSTLRSALLTNFLTPPLAAPGGATARRLTASAEAATAARTCVPLLVFLRAINLFSLLRPGRTCEWVRATYDVEATEDASVGPYGRLSESRAGLPARDPHVGQETRSIPWCGPIRAPSPARAPPRARRAARRRALARLPLPVLAAVVDEPEDAGTSTAFERDERHLRRQEVS